MNWIDVKNKLPKDYEEVLMVCENETGKRDIMTGYQVNGVWHYTYLFYNEGIFTELVNVTHWVKLPEFPGEKCKSGECEHLFEAINMSKSNDPYYSGEGPYKPRCMLCGFRP